mgnify:CR=1 FL=1
MNEINKIRGKTAVVGLAEAGCGVTPGWSAMELMATAVHDALDDAGINLSQVDGLFAATAFHSMAAMSLSEYLGIRPKFADGSNIGGSSFLAKKLDPPIFEPSANFGLIPKYSDNDIAAIE